MSTKQPDLGDFGTNTDAVDLKERWGITRETFRFRLREHATASKPEERMCEVCNSRVTQTKTMGEVGHSPGHGKSEERCPHFEGEN